MIEKRICIVVGARPNFVKVAPLIWAARKSSSVEVQLIYTGCEDDPTLESSLFTDLDMPRPDRYLGVDSIRLNEITSKVMAEFDAYLDEHPTDVVIVVDDLASTMAAAIVTKKRGISLAHLVAGTRSFDITMPKEINRLVIDALSDYLFTAGVKSTGVATREQTNKSETYMVGNILVDTLRQTLNRQRPPAVIDTLPKSDYMVLTINRRALLSDKDALTGILRAVGDVGMPVVAPMRDEASRVVLPLLDEVNCKNVVVTSPMGYLEFGWLTSHAKGILTDSGNVAEEATFNGVPCITLNDYTEHIETVTVGTNVLVGGDATKLKEHLVLIEKCQWKKCSLPDRWDGRTAERILKILTA